MRGSRWHSTRFVITNEARDLLSVAANEKRIPRRLKPARNDKNSDLDAGLKASSTQRSHLQVLHILGIDLDGLQWRHVELFLLDEVVRDVAALFAASKIGR